MTSNPASTSPVKRGNWVLDVVLGDPPPPAPPGVPSLEESAGDSESLSLREQLAIHRENPRCAGCHEQMDAIGLGLENFDAVGRWREEYRGRRIDASGELKGEPFDGPAELLSIIRRQERAIAVNFISRLMTYALGRGLRPVDRCVVTEIADRAEPHKYPTRMLVRQVALSTAFRKHGRGDRSRPPHTTPQASQEPQ